MKTITTCFSTFLLALTLVLVCASSGSAQNPSSPPASDAEPDSETRSASNGPVTTPVPPAEKPVSYNYLGSFEFIITIMVAAIGLIALAMEFLLLRSVGDLKAEDALRVFAVTLIIIGTLFFITAGFNSTQIAPAMGLFGTVAGYLLGRSIDRKESKESD
jgi:membrane associated rhomboid family serine protease